MKINYNDYPSILFTSFFEQEGPLEVKINVFSEKVIGFLAKCKGFNDLFPLISEKNTLKSKNSNDYFYLDAVLLSRIDNDLYRDNLSQKFLKTRVEARNGVLLFQGCAQYVYLLLSEEETWHVKRVKGMYIAVAVFMKDYFVGFEEAYITRRGVIVEPTGHYFFMDIGGYINFVIVCLMYSMDNPGKLINNVQVKEKVFLLT
ncbi:hypothetical protein [Butyricimonas virosa]|jgi:hypothetical protein